MKAITCPIVAHAVTDSTPSKTGLSCCSTGPSSNGRTADFGFGNLTVRILQHPAASPHSRSHEHPPKGATCASAGGRYARFLPPHKVAA